MAEREYLEASKLVLSSPRSDYKPNERRKMGRISLFGHQSVHDLREGFPLLTTKKMGFKTIAHELMWFLKGDTNIKYLVDNNVHIWDDDSFNHNLPEMVKGDVFPRQYERFTSDWESARDEYIERIKEDSEFASRWGDLGPVYGSQWIHWPKFEPISVDVNGEQKQFYLKSNDGIDQIASVVKGMKKNVTSSRHIVTAWNPAEVPNMALPPCHSLFQLNSNGEDFDLQLYQRSCDTFLGVPFNIASYAMLTTILAQELELKPRFFVHTFGDLHFYCGAGERAQWYRSNFETLKRAVSLLEKPGDYANYLEFLNDSLMPPEPEGREGEDHVTGILEQLSREPNETPRLKITNTSYKNLKIDDFSLEGYNPHSKIERKLIVG